MTAKYVKFKDYAGFVVRGTTPVPKPGKGHTHMQRAFYVVSKLEAANYGTVQNYDGAGMSGGPLHAIAVSPKTLKQGSLWRLLSDINMRSPELMTPVHNLLAIGGLRLQRGIVVDHSGSLASGKDLRIVLSGSAEGKVEDAPTSAQYLRAKNSVLVFNKLFSDAKTFSVQESFAIDWMINGNKAQENEVYRFLAARDVRQPKEWLRFATPEQVGPVLDLAMCFYHAFSVNAPSVAVQELNNACSKAFIEVPANVDIFARELIRGIGTRKFGKWADNPENTSRYDKTRRAMRDSGLWSKELISKYLPENLT